jgi:hypothetical protein
MNTPSWQRPEEYDGKTIWAKCIHWTAPKEGYVESEAAWWNAIIPSQQGLPRQALWYFVYFNPISQVPERHLIDPGFTLYHSLDEFTS